jgi:hypothetical protein
MVAMIHSKKQAKHPPSLDLKIEKKLRIVFTKETKSDPKQMEPKEVVKALLILFMVTFSGS